MASADFPGEARRLLREAIRPDLPVLYLQGASGDTSPWPMEHGGARNRSQRLQEIGATLFAETARLMRLAKPTDDVAVRHAFEDIEIPVRLPAPERLSQTRRTR